MAKPVVPMKNVIFRAILILVLYYQKDGIPKGNVVNTVAVPKPPEEISHVIIVETMIYMILVVIMLVGGPYHGVGWLQHVMTVPVGTMI